MISLFTIIGLVLALFFPGYLVTLIFFKEAKVLERIVLSVAFSIMISVAIGIALGYNENVKNITGGINKSNVWRWELILTAILGLMALVAIRKRVSFKGISSLKRRFKAIFKKRSKQKEIVVHKKL